MKGFPDLPPIWLAGFAAFVWMLGFVTPVIAGGAVRGVGSVLLGLGVVLILWSAWMFLRHSTPIEPHHDPNALIETGPFVLTRNPIYVAMALMLAGWALWSGIVLGLVLVPLFQWIITRRFILGEEQRLRAAFGQSAEAYIARTRRWVLR